MSEQKLRLWQTVQEELEERLLCEQNVLTSSQGGRQTDNHFTTNPNLTAKLRSVATMLGKPEPLCPSQESCWLVQWPLARNPVGTRWELKVLIPRKPAPQPHRQLAGGGLGWSGQQAHFRRGLGRPW